MRVFKVVRKFAGDVFTSCVVHDYTDVALYYRLNERTVAKRGTAGVLVFTNLQDAENFASDQERYVDYYILHCGSCGEVLRVRRLIQHHLSRDYVIPNYSRRKILRKFSNPKYYMLAPPGSYSVSSVVPIKCVGKFVSNRKVEDDDEDDDKALNP